jgi:hypothetical protein
MRRPEFIAEVVGVVAASAAVPLSLRAQPLDQIGPLPLEMFAVQPISPAVNKIRSKDIAAIEAA